MVHGEPLSYLWQPGKNCRLYGRDHYQPKDPRSYEKTILSRGSQCSTHIVLGGFMNIEHIREFLTLSETLSFTRTASLHYLTQPVLSRHIRALEEELGMMLFERSTHQVVLTHNGQYAYSKFSRLIDCFDEVLHDIRIHSEATTASLNFGIIHYGINNYLERFITAVDQVRPGTEVSVLPLHANDIITALFANEIDAGLTVGPAISDFDSLDSFKVADEAMLLMVPNASEMANSAEVSLADLRDCRVVLAKRESWQKEIFIGAFESAGYSFTGTEILGAEQIEVLPQALIRYDGVALVPAHIGTMGSNQVKLVPVKENPSVSICCVFRRDNRNSSLLRRLRDALKQ